MRRVLNSLTDVKKELKKKLKGKPSAKPQLTNQEKALIQMIERKTRQWNLNNVTRTEAYLQFYLKYPEIHWAFLGHMVSRNGGWNMTDLKGDWYSYLLSKEEQTAFFAFLERGNWLIFQDIYPQFLVYEEGRKRGKNLFYLLPFLNVSTFMETMWNDFLKRRDPYPLTMALIVNEQNYLEQRVIQIKDYKESVLNTVGFKLYDFFRFNHILFPYYGGDPKRTALTGDTSTHFSSLHERIMLGKRLYDLLFGNHAVLPKTIRWAKDHPHTGSRKDYWPHLFNTINESGPRELYKRRIKECELIKGAPRLYSPPLSHAWANYHHPKAEEGDWFNDWHVIDYLIKREVKPEGDISKAYCQTLETIELAILAKSILP